MIHFAIFSGNFKIITCVIMATKLAGDIILQKI